LPKVNIEKPKPHLKRQISQRLDTLIDHEKLDQRVDG